MDRCFNIYGAGGAGINILNQLLKESKSQQFIKRPGLFAGTIELTGNGFRQCLLNQRAFAAARNTGDANQTTERNLHVDVL